jgi:2-polyprenyl-3-methyl-5-hydroxy-6-metoxy-1,4-benzoquinol methylase
MNMASGSGTQALRVAPVPACPACGAGGAILHEDLADHLFGVPGTWRIVRCDDPECGVLWLDPAPVEEDMGLAYQSYYTHADAERPPARSLRGPWRWVKQGYLASRFGYQVPAAGVKRILSLLLAPFPTRRESLDALVMHLPARPGSRMLDVGCGDGSVLDTLSQLGWQVEGVDFDPRVINTVARRGFQVHLGTLEAQNFADRTFDAVTASHVLEHVREPETFLCECHRVLRPGGTLTILTPNALSYGHRRFGRAWRGLEPPRHLQVFTAPSLDQLAERAGFPERRLWSSARMAAFIHRQSRNLERGTPHAPTSGRKASRFQLDERRRLRTDRWAGEELVLVASRR